MLPAPYPQAAPARTDTRELPATEGVEAVNPLAAAWEECVHEAPPTPPSWEELSQLTGLPVSAGITYERSTLMPV
jgi:hypothetical protein